MCRVDEQRSDGELYVDTRCSTTSHQLRADRVDDQAARQRRVDRRPGAVRAPAQRRRRQSITDAAQGRLRADAAVRQLRHSSTTTRRRHCGGTVYVG